MHIFLFPTFILALNWVWQISQSGISTRSAVSILRVIQSSTQSSCTKPIVPAQAHTEIIGLAVSQQMRQRISSWSSGLLMHFSECQNKLSINYIIILSVIPLLLFLYCILSLSPNRPQQNQSALLSPQSILKGERAQGGHNIIIFNLMSRQNTEQQLRKEINDLENQILDLETFYLENTRDSGNLIKGFDNYLNARAPRNQINKKPKIENVERLFSLTSVRSKTSQAFDEAFLGQKHDSNQVLPKRNRIRNNTKGKGYNMIDVESADNNSGSGDIVYSMDESSNNNNNKGRKKKSRIPSGGKGTRK